MMMYHPIKFGHKQISSSADMADTVMSPQCDYELEDSKPVFFQDTHHTKFGYKRFSSWEEIIQMNIPWNF